MNNHPKAIDDFESLCFKCLSKKETRKYSLYRSEYGSSFDNNYTYLQICDSCEPEDIEKWFNEEPEIVDDYLANYKYEQNIIDFIDTFPLEGQELFWNSCAHGACADNMGSQDWIDMKLGILPDEMYEKYGMYSPTTIKLYQERFPTCNHPVHKVYDDGSKGCWCVFGASGEYGQKAGYNTSGECAKCLHYIPRYEPIKEVTSDEFELYKKYYIGKLNYLNLKDKFE